MGLAEPQAQVQFVLRTVRFAVLWSTRRFFETNDVDRETHHFDTLNSQRLSEYRR